MSAATLTGRFVRSHPRSLAGAAMLGLAGFGVTAFGIAPLAPDAALPPQRTVIETVALSSLSTQVDALAESALQLYRSDLTRTSDTADSLLRRLNVSDAAAADFLRTDALGRKALEGRGGKMVQVRTDEHAMLSDMVVRYAATGALAATHFNRLHIRRVGAGFEARLETSPLAAQVRLGSGTVRSTLYAATDEAQIPDGIATQLAEAFATDIDFHQELRRGATFSVVYEALTADGEPITWNTSAGRLLGAEFVNDGDTYSAVWFQDGQGKGAWFGFDGKNKRHAFLTSPMEFSRVTSGFALRLHPILNTWKQHKGVDYGAPAGTPVRAVGEGRVDFAGWQNGYGNIVEIRHSNQRSTLYAHLNRIDVERGAHVDQGDRLGSVGSTGWATGPHLHFEVKLQGVQQDPGSLARAGDTFALAPASRAQFAKVARTLQRQLDLADSVAPSALFAE